MLLDYSESISASPLLKRLYKHLLCTLLYSTLFSSILFSQKAYIPDKGDPINESWRWSTFGKLAGKGVRCIAESDDGNIWVGINCGVTRYNGLDWMEYNSSNGFIDSSVFQLVNVRDKGLYAGSNSGLYVFKDKEWKKIFPINNHPLNDQLKNIHALIKLNDGSIVASVGSGIYRGLVTFHNSEISFMASKKTIEAIGSQNGMNMIIVPDDKCIDSIFCVEEVFQDSQKRIWTWTSQFTEIGNVFYYTSNADSRKDIQYSKNFTSSDGLVKADRVKFGEDNEGNIWLVNNRYNVGISIFNGSKWRYFKLKGENTHLSITNANGEIWIGGFAILNLYKDGKWKKYQRPLTAIPDSYISVYKDSKGYLWIIGTQSELIRIDYSDRKWSSYKSLNFQCQDKSNNLWFLSVDGKVVIKKENNWFSYSSVDGLPDAPVKIYCTKKGQICVAGSYREHACISFLNMQKWERQVFPELSWGIDYRAIFEDADGNLWIGASVNFDPQKGHKSGIMKFQHPGTSKQKITHYLPSDGIEMSNAYGLAQTKDGTIWLAGRHLAQFSDDHWSRFTDIEELNQYINCMGNTPDGVLWIGSRRSGVFRFKNNNWSNFNLDNGLKSNTIISILPVNDHDIWIATNRDFGRFDGTSWISDLLPDNFTLSREGGDIQIQSDGTLWINQSSREWKRRALNNNSVEQEDIDYFSTFSYKADTIKPETMISVYSEEVPPPGNTYIKWKGIDTWHTSPTSKLHYSYRLNDGEWSEYSYKKNITYSHLKNGKYKFEVKARDMDFNVDPTPDVINFVVLPPVWKQAWFIILILFFLVVIIAYQYSAIKRNKNLEKLNKQLEKHSDEIERKNLLLEEQKEQILQQNILEKEINRGKIKFFTNISHEFRTPLTLVTGVIENLSEETSQKNPTFFQKQLATIKRNSNQLLRLINQLMDFRKLENNSLYLRISESDIVSFMNDICDSFQKFSEKQQINLEFSSDFDVLEAWFDRDKMESVLYNLISNAVKFTSAGGNIAVKLKSLPDKKTKRVGIIIEDTGIGIPDNEIKKIVEPFYQVKDTDGSNYEGTGIGLSIAYNFVKLHHATMEIISSIDEKVQLERGFSTRFTISMSLDKSAYDEKEIIRTSEAIDPLEESVYSNEDIEKEAISDPALALELPNKRTEPLIVIVEDNDDLRRYMVNSLNSLFKVFDASNGSDGFDLVATLLPDLVISDILMPQMTGTELCKKLKKDQRTSHIPVILLTARTTDENKIEGYQIGVDDYITKPFNMALLVARINNMLDRHARLKRKYKNEEITQPDEVQVSSIDDQFLQKVKTVVETNFSNHLFGVEELSNEMGISGRHLLYKLQNLIDMTPVEYIRVFRLKRAAQLLVNKKASISEIVYETGFNDISYFGKCFTKYFGMNPSKYIKTYFKKEEK